MNDLPQEGPEMFAIVVASFDYVSKKTNWRLLVSDQKLKVL